MTLEYLASIFNIILVDLVLSGDNAVVIALAARLLPPRQRRQAMLWGCGLAIVLRIALTFVVSYLLLIPGLRLFGALMLGWIACKLLLDEAEAGDETRPPPTNLLKAINRIVMADFIMSLDNVFAVAGVSQGDGPRMIFGLVVSITMLLTLSAAIMSLMNRYPWIVYAGTAVLALAAAEMLLKDVESFMSGPAGADPAHHVILPPWVVWGTRAAFLVVCMTAAQWWPGKRANGGKATTSTTEPVADEPAELAGSK